MAESKSILDEFKTNQEVKEIDTSVKLKVGIIGCGWIAKAHMREYLKMPDVEVVAFADLIPGKAEAFAQNYGIDGRCYSSHAEFFDESLSLWC